MEQVIKKLLEGQYIARDKTNSNFYTFWDTGLVVYYFHSSFFTLRNIDTIVKHNDKWYLFNSHLIEGNQKAIRDDIEKVFENGSIFTWVECVDTNLLQYRQRLAFDDL